MIGASTPGPAPSTVHQGAIYLHGGRTFEVDGVRLDDRRALVRPFDGNWYTQPKRETDTQIEQVLAQRTALGVRLSFGTVVVSEQVLAYQRRRSADHEAMDLIPLDLPQTSFSTQALWYELEDDDLGTLHAAEHSQIAVLPLLAMCDRWDIGGLSTNYHEQTGGPTIFIYDGHPGRDRDRPPRLRGVRAAGRRRLPARQRVPVRVGLPVVRAVAQVRQPQRAAGQGRLRRADARDATSRRPRPVARAAGRSARRPWSPTSR